MILKQQYSAFTKGIRIMLQMDLFPTNSARYE